MLFKKSGQTLSLMLVLLIVLSLFPTRVPAANAPMLARMAEINVGLGLSFDSSILGESTEQR